MLRTPHPERARFWELLAMTTPSVMFPRKVFVDAGGFATDLYFMEDKELFLRVGFAHARRTTGQAWRELAWVKRYDRDIWAFAFRAGRLMRPSEWRHLAKKISILQADLAMIFEDHGARGRARRAQALSAVLSPLEVDGYRRLASRLGSMVLARG